VPDLLELIIRLTKTKLISQK